MTRGYGFRVNFSVPELSETLQQINKYNSQTAYKIEQQVSKSTKAIGRGAKQRVPVLSGDLKKSISTRFDAKTITGYIAARQPYAHLVEFGAKATVTKPTRQRKALKIPWQGGFGVGGMYYAAKADIPQRRERPFMRPAFEDEKPNLIKGIKEAVKP
ncbi:MAG TPA: HK97 gp10 family phage protein [Bacillota bacterium]|nr:HK97 gp10 family phage protein [Bacillota bacterium]